MFNDHQWQKGNWVAQTDPLPFLPTPSCTLQITVRHSSPCHNVCLRTNKKKWMLPHVKPQESPWCSDFLRRVQWQGNLFPPITVQILRGRLETEQSLGGGGPEKLAAVQLLLPLKHLSTATTTPTPTHTLTMCETHPGTYASDLEASHTASTRLRCLNRCPEFLAAAAAAVLALERCLGTPGVRPRCRSLKHD